MKPPPATEIVERLSDNLQDILVREAFVRKRREVWQAEVGAKKAQTVERAQTRSAFMIFRGKGAKESFETAGEKLAAEVAALERGIEDCEVILKKCAKTIEADFESFMETQSAEFGNLRSAQKLMPEWEEAIGIHRSRLKRFITALGIARNQMSSGYNRSAGTFAPGALEAFDSAWSAAKTLETGLTVPNLLAKRYRQLLGVDVAPTAVLPDHVIPLPYVDTHSVVQQVAAFKTATIEVAAARISALIDECEKMHGDGVTALLGELTRAQASHEAAQKRWVATPLAEIRAMADGMIDPAQMDAVYTAMVARFVSLTG